MKNNQLHLIYLYESELGMSMLQCLYKTWGIAAFVACTEVLLSIYGLLESLSIL